MLSKSGWRHARDKKRGAPDVEDHRRMLRRKVPVSHKNPRGYILLWEGHRVKDAVDRRGAKTWRMEGDVEVD